MFSTFSESKRKAWEHEAARDMREAAKERRDEEMHVLEKRLAEQKLQQAQSERMKSMFGLFSSLGDKSSSGARKLALGLGGDLKEFGLTDEEIQQVMFGN